MGLIKDRIESLIGTTGLTGEDNLYQSAINEVMDLLPNDLLMKYAPSPILLSDAQGTTWSMPEGSKILDVSRSDSGVERRATQVTLPDYSRANDSNSIYYRTNFSPIYALDTATGTTILKVAPTPSDSDNARIYYISYLTEGEQLLSSAGRYDGDFEVNVTSSNWQNSQAGWTWSSDNKNLEHAASNTTDITFSHSGYPKAITNGASYIVKWDLTHTSGGGVSFKVGNGTASAIQSASGSVTLVSGSTVANVITIIPESDFVGTIDNISVKRVGRTADLSNDEEISDFPKTAEHAVVLKSSINILMVKLSNAVQDEEDVEVMGMIKSQLEELRVLFREEMNRLGGGAAE
jgi:hypothetical protein